MNRRTWILCAGTLLVLTPALAPAALPPASVRAHHIPVEGMVEGVMLKTLERRIDTALEGGAEILIFEIDSYGGRVDFAESIAHLIDTTTGVKKVAYVTNKAISAGAFIALSCDEIVMRSTATLGDCQPIIPTLEGPRPAGEKAESAFREKMAAYAEARGYPVALARAMVSPGIEVLRIPGAEGRAYEFVERSDLDSWSENLLRQRQIISDWDPASDGTGPRRYTVLVDGQEEEITIVDKAGEILTVDGEEAREYGLARFLAEDLDQVLALYEIKPEEVVTLRTLWWEHFVILLNTMPAKALLIVVGLLALFIELKAPGFGVPGVLGIACFGLLFFATHLAGLAQWIEIIMFGSGLVLIAAEILIIPGFGVAGIAGIALVVSGLLLALVSFSPAELPRTAYHWQELKEAVTWLFAGLGGFVVGVVVLVRFLPKTPILDRIVLSASMPAEEGFAARIEMGRSLIGKRGESRTVLRPAGKIEVEGVTYDAAAQGDFIQAGESVIIVDTSGNRILVRKD